MPYFRSLAFAVALAAGIAAAAVLPFAATLQLG
jgi:hypothetical protein